MKKKKKPASRVYGLFHIFTNTTLNRLGFGIFTLGTEFQYFSLSLLAKNEKTIANVWLYMYLCFQLIIEHECT